MLELHLLVHIDGPRMLPLLALHEHMFRPGIALIERRRLDLVASAKLGLQLRRYCFLLHSILMRACLHFVAIRPLLRTRQFLIMRLLLQGVVVRVRNIDAIVLLQDEVVRSRTDDARIYRNASVMPLVHLFVLVLNLLYVFQIVGYHFVAMESKRRLSVLSRWTRLNGVNFWSVHDPLRSVCTLLLILVNDYAWRWANLVIRALAPLELLLHDLNVVVHLSHAVVWKFVVSLVRRIDFVGSISQIQ